MARRRKKERVVHKYQCSITEEEFKFYEKSENPDDLMSLKAYYELNEADDDRPDYIKKQLGLLEK